VSIDVRPKRYQVLLTKCSIHLYVATALCCTTAAGDVLFVPAGCAHQVENIGCDTTIAVSFNYVDKSNLFLVFSALATQVMPVSCTELQNNCCAGIVSIASMKFV
jgi:oxalate decarboxylase/phosphoglucose isomerase-like protein (cupin superfamily)